MSDLSPQQTRQSLVDHLARRIVSEASTITGTESASGKLTEIEQRLAERLTFEANVLLNETVTKLNPARPAPAEGGKPERRFERFGINFRLQHMLMFVSVIMLIITGIPLKFPEYGLARFIIMDVFGGLQNSGTVHRIGAIGLIIVGLWHVVYIVFSRTGRRDFFLMIPRLKDITDAMHTILYFLGVRQSPARFGRFSFIEKFDYWAVYWGMVIMIGTGLILWYKELFSKYVYDIGREAHSDEGLLATLAIVIWHFYNVHFNPDVFPGSLVWWHGKLTEKEMKHHHPLEYATIMEKEAAAILQQKKGDGDTQGSKP